ncbi:hypothetical protein AAA799P11_01205 [Marine Group I thaumarchaeote SCGC AAA799-P11]|uniref:Blue copper domain-containing protein n=1 Tax=Marine Group I thaumarchaeote SCGC AAA799-P11 TaxID=1502295 RepID=A0A087RXH5_9ARCH|nr:hypothetical protein AAA799P11_01205 [Marine Group I thaumarchaeote SCGC AAA799-P11]
MCKNHTVSSKSKNLKESQVKSEKKLLDEIKNRESFYKMSNSSEHMRKFLSLLFLIAFSMTIQNTYAETFSIEPVSGSGASGCEETTDGCYIPSTVTVDVGSVVIMSNTDTAAHTFTAGTPEDGPSGLFDTGLLMAGNSFNYSPDAEGVIPYFCMVHPWMIGKIIVGNYSSPESEETMITVKMNGPSIFYLDSPNKIIRALVEIHNYDPSDGYYFMKVTHLPTNTILKDFEIFPKDSGNNMMSARIAYPILESDIEMGGQKLFGEYEIYIWTESSSHTASVKFSILESQEKSIPEPEPTPEPTPEPKTQDETSVKLQSENQNEHVKNPHEISASVNREFVEWNEEIIVSGYVKNVKSDLDYIHIELVTDWGEIVSRDQTRLKSDNSFEYSYLTGGTIHRIDQTGVHIIRLNYGYEEFQDIPKDEDWKELQFVYCDKRNVTNPEYLENCQEEYGKVERYYIGSQDPEAVKKAKEAQPPILEYQSEKTSDLSDIESESTTTTSPTRNPYDVAICHEYNSDGSCKSGTAYQHLDRYFEAERELQTQYAIAGIVVTLIIIGIIVGIVVGIRKKLKNRHKKIKKDEEEKLEQEKIQWKLKQEQDNEIQELKDKVKKLEEEKKDE